VKKKITIEFFDKITLGLSLFFKKETIVPSKQKKQYVPMGMGLSNRVSVD
jgi:hypothetical protein